MSLLKDLTSFLDDLNESTSNFLVIPIALVSAVVKVVVVLLSIATFPVRVAQAIARSYPVLTLVMLSLVIVCFLIIRKITRQSVVSYFLYTCIPYCFSIVYTVFALFFPQVHAFSRIVQVLLHPIRWLLGIAEQVDSRARPIREVVEVFSPGSERRRSGTSFRQQTSTSTMSFAEKANNERIQCCVCIYREKTILLRPCNHICLCETCFQAVMNEPPPKCPICRTTIESFMNVFL